jgi:sialic acid synthase SpsE
MAGKTFIIAEAGSNHNNSWDNVLLLIDAAHAAGADAIKFQLFTGEGLYCAEVEVADYLVKAGKAQAGDRISDLLDRIALPREWVGRIKSACDDAGIEFMATPFDCEAVSLLDEAGVKRFKVASSELNNFQILDRIAQTRKPIILSCGMATLADIERAVEFLKARDANDVTPLHCTVRYPAGATDVNMRALETLRAAFGFPVGFSDHTMSNVAGILAVAMGAAIVEKHFTLDRSLPGPDHFFALTPPELTAYVAALREAEEALGSSRIEVRECEKDLAKYRTGLVLRHPVKRGECVAESDVIMKRPGWGIPTHMMSAVVGRKAIRDLPAEHILSWDDFMECGNECKI